MGCKGEGKLQCPSRGKGTTSSTLRRRPGRQHGRRCMRQGRAYAAHMHGKAITSEQGRCQADSYRETEKGAAGVSYSQMQIHAQILPLVIGLQTLDCRGRPQAQWKTLFLPTWKTLRAPTTSAVDLHRGAVWSAAKSDSFRTTTGVCGDHLPQKSSSSSSELATTNGPCRSDHRKRRCVAGNASGTGLW